MPLSHKLKVSAVLSHHSPFGLETMDFADFLKHLQLLVDCTAAYNRLVFDSYLPDFILYIDLALDLFSGCASSWYTEAAVVNKLSESSEVYPSSLEMAIFGGLLAC